MGLLEISIYVVIGIVLLIGLKEILYYFMWSWNEQGKMFTTFGILSFLLFLNIFASKQWFPQFEDTSKLLFYAFILGGILYRLIRVKKRG